MEQEFHENDKEGQSVYDGAFHGKFIDLCQDLTMSQAPEWVELLPKAPHVKARDGRQWHYSPQRILKAFAANKGPLVIDYEHGQHHRARNGLEAPASGWIEELTERDGAIWGRVKWTDMAAKKIVTGEYRYLSPEFRHSKNGEILSLAGAGLVNRPALVMTALSREHPSTPPLTPPLTPLVVSPTTLMEEMMDLTAIASALSLAEDAKPVEILTSIAAREKERVELNAQLTKAREDLALLQEEQKNTAIERLLDKAVEEGKILPAAREDYRALCRLEGGIKHFQSLIEKLPALASTSPLEVCALVQEHQLAPEEIALAARHYQEEQKQKGFDITISQAVDYIYEHKERSS
ncbi:phage protease [Bartonella massiliensis]|uniref:phage protease n=1 Tax=Bartonella massiliensis TaxID=929795 RepID=UPI001157AF69|nr:phage protease [Bartonella massiliensis]